LYSITENWWFLDELPLILPPNSDDIKRLTITGGVNAQDASMIGLLNIVGANENIMKLIKY